jgi:hypothetical protein
VLRRPESRYPFELCWSPAHPAFSSIHSGLHFDGTTRQRHKDTCFRTLGFLNVLGRSCGRVLGYMTDVKP